MKLLCIVSNPNDKSVLLLKESAQKRNIEFIEINPKEADITKLNNLDEQTLLYRNGISKECFWLEKFLLNEKMTTFYKSLDKALSKWVYPFSVYRLNDLPIPQTFPVFSKERNNLREIVKELGGFPVILKVVGGTHGVGVMKIDSYESLFSIVDFMMQKKQQMILRKFVDVRSSARLIVLGNQVVDSIQYNIPADDFRSNVGSTPNVEPKKFTNDINNLAIKVAENLGYEFGGVDILIDNENRPYVTEINFPCYYPRCQLLTGTDISGMMIDHLVSKANSKQRV